MGWNWRSGRLPDLEWRHGVYGRRLVPDYRRPSLSITDLILARREERGHLQPALHEQRRLQVRLVPGVEAVRLVDSVHQLYAVEASLRFHQHKGLRGLQPKLGRYLVDRFCE